MYTVTPTSATDASGADVLDTVKTFGDLCIKVAKPMFCRSLAREAWFYERLIGIQGTATARCFGLYTTTIDMGDFAVSPWVKSNDYPFNYPKREDLSDEDMPSTDWLPDDVAEIYPEIPKYTDDHGFKRDSPWNTWEPSKNAPILSILLLQKLGKTYSDALPQARDKPKKKIMYVRHTIVWIIVTLIFVTQSRHMQCD